MTAKPRPLYYIMRTLAIIIQPTVFGTLYIYLRPDAIPFTEIWQRTIVVITITFSLAACILICCYNEANLRKLRRQCALPDTIFSLIPSVTTFVPWYSIPANCICSIAISLHLELTFTGCVPLLYAMFTVILRYIVSHDDFLKRFKQKLAEILPKRRVSQIAS